MPTTCPKCHYVRLPTDLAPDYECPQCGVVYAKVGQRPAPREFRDTKPQALEAPRRNIVLTSSHKLALASLALGLCIGYFAGREHIKYEMRSAIQEAAAGFRKGLGAIAGLDGPLGAVAKKSAETVGQRDAAPPAKPKVYPIVARLKSKGFEEGEYGRGNIVFQVAFANGTGKNIRAFDGNLVFQDLLGNEILGANLAINDPVVAGTTLEWSGRLGFNRFMNQHQNLRDAEIQNIQLQFVPKKVLFEDGEVKDF